MTAEPHRAPKSSAGVGPGQEAPHSEMPPRDAGSQGAAPAGAGQAASPPLLQHKIRPTRVSGIWVAAVSFAVVLLLLLIFNLQNSHTVDVSFFGAHGHLPLGVAMLLAAVCGVLLVALPGTARIVQLRVTARRHRNSDAQAIVTRHATH